MKIQTWVPEKRPIARTLADVPSSRENPVLCWWNGSKFLRWWNGSKFLLCFDGNVVHWLDAQRKWHAFSKLMLPIYFELYDQPPRPTKLEDVPDRRIVVSKDPVEGLLYFRLNGQWFCRSSCCAEGFAEDVGPGVDWQLTDCIAELVEVEVEVMG